MSATDRSPEPDLDSQWSNPIAAVTRYTIIADNDDLTDALNSFRQTFATIEIAEDELATWNPEHRPHFRVVRIRAEVSEVQP